MGVLILALLLAFGTAHTGSLAQDAQGSGGSIVVETDSGKHSFNIEVADDAAKRTMGLMYRRSMPEKSGMLFVYEKPQGIFMWMKNTYIPLDMLFINADGTIRSIARNTEPFSEAPIGSGGEVLGVLELNAGMAEKIGVDVGDRVIHPAFKSG